jgi:hypothetical protein
VGKDGGGKLKVWGNRARQINWNSGYGGMCSEEIEMKMSFSGSGVKRRWEKEDKERETYMCSVNF